MTDIGIDYSSRKVAVALLGGRLPATLEVKSYECHRKYKFDDCLPRLLIWMEDFIQDHGRWISTPVNVVIEKPISGVSMNVLTAVNMAMVAGGLYQVASEAFGTMPIFVGPTAWKKAVCGKGNYRKDQVSEWLSSNFPELAALCQNQDEVDAMCMALYARSLHGKTESS